MAFILANNNGSQDSLLKSVKPAAGSIQLESGLKLNEEKLAKSILNSLFLKSETDDTYLLELTSKSIDATLGRIASLLEQSKSEFTANELENVKNAIVNAVESQITVLNNKSISILNVIDKVSTKIVEIEQQLSSIIKDSLQDFFKDNSSQENSENNNNEDDKVIEQNTTTIQDFITAQCNVLQKKYVFAK